LLHSSHESTKHSHKHDSCTISHDSQGLKVWNGKVCVDILSHWVSFYFFLSQQLSTRTSSCISTSQSSRSSTPSSTKSTQWSWWRRWRHCGAAVSQMTKSIVPRS
jgi:hypothetical protein